MSLKEKIFNLISQHPSVAPVVDVQLAPKVDTIITFNPIEGTFVIEITNGRSIYCKESSESITIGIDSCEDNQIVITGKSDAFEDISSDVVYFSYGDIGFVHSFDGENAIEGIPSEITINATPYDPSSEGDTSK